jgi:hypothetical protein
VHSIPYSLSHHISNPKHPSSWVEVAIQEAPLLGQHGTEISSMRHLKIGSSHISNGCTTTTYLESHGLDGKETMRIVAYKFCNIFGNLTLQFGAPFVHLMMQVLYHSIG